MASYFEMKLLPSAIQLGAAAEGAKLAWNKNTINDSISFFDVMNTHSHTHTHGHTLTSARYCFIFIGGF